jgi:DnaK suppressor protein
MLHLECRLQRFGEGPGLAYRIREGRRGGEPIREEQTGERVQDDRHLWRCRAGSGGVSPVNPPKKAPAAKGAKKSATKKVAAARSRTPARLPEGAKKVAAARSRTPARRPEGAKKVAAAKKVAPSRGHEGAKKVAAAVEAPAVSAPGKANDGEVASQEKIAPGSAKDSSVTRSAKEKVAGGRSTKTEHAAPATATAKRTAPAKPAQGPYADDEKFLQEQRQLLLDERLVYQHQAEDLRAEAESLALEREPGDVQFDEESGEGGTVAVDRERDLTLSAQALATIEEIDAALAAIDSKTYGACEKCGQPIPKARLRALPYARLCVACKSGGLHRR